MALTGSGSGFTTTGCSTGSGYCCFGPSSLLNSDCNIAASIESDVVSLRACSGFWVCRADGPPSSFKLSLILRESSEKIALSFYEISTFGSDGLSEV